MLGPARSFSADGKKKEVRQSKKRKHPTKLVKAATCCLLSPITTTTSWILRGPRVKSSFFFSMTGITQRPYFSLSRVCVSLRKRKRKVMTSHKANGSKFLKNVIVINTEEKMGASIACILLVICILPVTPCVLP